MSTARRAAALTVLSAGLVSSVATSYAEPCTWGAWPHDGATAVALDTRITFQGGYLQDDLPAITDDVAGLELWPQGTRVPVSVDVDVDANLVTLTPQTPLLPGQDYRAYGLDLQEQASVNHVEGGYEHTLPASVIFSTASDPQVLAAYAWTDDGDWPVTLVVVASQPLDAASLADHGLVVDTEGVMAEPPATSLGFYEGEGHLAWFELDRPDADAEHETLADASVRFADGVTAADGTSLPQGGVDLDFTQSATLDRYRGLRDCRYWE